jgi:nitrite reductase (NO-forming)
MKRSTVAMVGGIGLALVTAAAAVVGTVKAQAPPSTLLPEVQAIITAPPLVPPPVDRMGPARVLVSLETKERKGTLADGVEYVFWSFGDTVPGPFVRVRLGDTIVLKLKNSEGSDMPHSIDLHAVTGPGGGAAVTQLGPGHEGAFEWRAMNPGLYVYHCATPHVPTHITNGMYGLILVEPAGGLPRVDREYYVMQGEFYTKGRTLEPGKKGAPQELDVEKLRNELPEYVVFNGRMGALLNDGALKAKVGETVRFYVGNGGPNLLSSFHVIGEIMDTVYGEAEIGGTPRKNVQTTLVPAGGAAIVDLKLDVPGRFLLVDHSISRAMDKGALGIIEVEGAERPEIFKVLTAGSHGSGGH